MKSISRANKKRIVVVLLGMCTVVSSYRTAQAMKSETVPSTTTMIQSVDNTPPAVSDVWVYFPYYYYYYYPYFYYAPYYYYYSPYAYYAPYYYYSPYFYFYVGITL